MSGASAAGLAAKPVTKQFRRSSQGVISTPDQRRREAAVMRLAWDALGSPERIMAFLNGHSDALGGRPLQLASGSDDGLARVAALLEFSAAATTVLGQTAEHG